MHFPPSSSNCCSWSKDHVTGLRDVRSCVAISAVAKKMPLTARRLFCVPWIKEKPNCTNNSKTSGISFHEYHIYSNKRPGRLFNFLTLGWTLLIRARRLLNFHHFQPYICWYVYYPSTKQRRKNTVFAFCQVFTIFKGMGALINFFGLSRWALIRINTVCEVS